MTWTTKDVWATAEDVGGNPVRQLLVPAGNLALGEDATTVSGQGGTWPTARVGTTPPSRLHLRIPLTARYGVPLRDVSWAGSKARADRLEVLSSYDDALTLRAESSQRPGLRRPQVGAVHAVLAFATTGRTAACTVVMPTGTGKTDTMLALLVALRPPSLLVIVPSDALRLQLAERFERLGVLHATGVAASAAMRPVVGRMLHSFADAETARAFRDACNVVVATTSAINACAPDIRAAFLDGFTHLFVDEAHHVPAETWRAIRSRFDGKRVVQFTATPFRLDGRHIGGELVYTFPLREAQRDGYFAKINFRSVVDLRDEDEALLHAAVSTLREDLGRGLNHLMMVRARSRVRAEELHTRYVAAAPDLKPVLLHHGLPASRQESALDALKAGESRVVVCVNMLGEGYDLPQLKVAAVHDAQKSLGVTLQFVGRFTRTAAAQKLGDATVLVARGDTARDPRLRQLYAEDSDWNAVIQELSDEAVDAQRAITEFEAGFTSLPEEITLRNLQPKMSTVVYRTPTDEWNPLALEDFFAEESLLTEPIGLNQQVGVAWCVVQHVTPVRWGDVRTMQDTVHELYVAYFDAARRLLYINSSGNDGTFQELADALAGPSRLHTGDVVYRVFGGLQRLIPTNIGLLDARSAFRRFSMLVGSDVHSGFSDVEASTKTQTHIAASGYSDGEKVNISAAISGRVWSPQTASTLKAWVDWCDGVGDKILDSTITLDGVIAGFLWPAALEERPRAVLLGAEWPSTVLEAGSGYPQIHPPRGTGEFLGDVDVLSASHEETGPFLVAFECTEWRSTYAADVIDNRLQYRHYDGPSLEISSARRTRDFHEWLNEYGLTLLLDGDRIITPDSHLLDSSAGTQPFAPERLNAIDWAGIDLTVEAQGPQRNPASIQARMVRHLLAEEWDVVLDDDGSGEAADIVALRIAAGRLEVCLVHCKYAGGNPGARVGDLYELCGQAQKSAALRDRDMQPLFEKLTRRARRRLQRTGTSPFEVGDLQILHRLQDDARLLAKKVRIVLAQPGLSRARVSESQLNLLGATQLYVRQRANAELTVCCSA